MKQKQLTLTLGALLTASSMATTLSAQDDSTIGLRDYPGKYTLTSGSEECAEKIEIKSIDGCLIMIELTSEGEWRDLNHFCKVNDGPRVTRTTGTSYPAKLTTTKHETTFAAAALTDVYEMTTLNAFGVAEIAVRTNSRLALNEIELVWKHNHSRLEMFKMPTYVYLDCTYERGGQ